MSESDQREHRTSNPGATQRQAFNDLSFAEAEGLALLAEECGETVQAIGKLLRHGAWSTHPDSPEGPNNLDNLCKEIGDVLAAVDILGLKWGDIQAARKKKLAKVGYYLHHAKVPAVETTAPRWDCACNQAACPYCGPRLAQETTTPRKHWFTARHSAETACRVCGKPMSDDAHTGPQPAEETSTTHEDDCTCPECF